MAKIEITATIKARPWFMPMAYIGGLLIALGASPDKIGAWVAKYGVSVKLNGH